ncbi:MAG: HIT domain-containing protein [Anaerolineales bacterium]|nr:HIT domain-containing protein [Anaerolineales bacterium]
MPTCRYCLPRPANPNRVEVAVLRRSTLFLNRDQRFRGYCVLVYDGPHAEALEALAAGEYSAFMADLHQAAAALRAACRPALLNYECMGNQMRHLHWHVVPRYPTDPRWGYPIWDGQPFEGREIFLPEAELLALRDHIRSHLAAA